MHHLAFRLCKWQPTATHRFPVEHQLVARMIGNSSRGPSHTLKFRPWSRGSGLTVSMYGSARPCPVSENTPNLVVMCSTCCMWTNTVRSRVLYCIVYSCSDDSLNSACHRGLCASTGHHATAKCHMRYCHCTTRPVVCRMRRLPSHNCPISEM